MLTTAAGIASASPPRPGQPDRVAGPSAVRSLPGLAGHPSGAGTGAAAPAATYAYAAFTSDTCTVATFGPHFECMATGYYIDHGIHALGMCWEQGMVMWNGCYPADAVAKNLVTLPLGVSCSSPNFTTCSLVGEHYCLRGASPCPRGHSRPHVTAGVSSDWWRSG